MGDESPTPRRILLAEDEADVRSTLKQLLEFDRHSVVEACDGRQALNLLKSHRFDLVITDYLMPGMPGDQLVAELKKQAPELPIIMITANMDLLPNPIPGVDVLLPKPFQVADLREAIRRVS